MHDQHVDGAPEDEEPRSDSPALLALLAAAPGSEVRLSEADLAYCVRFLDPPLG